MEKYIKNLSIALMVLTSLFFLNMFGAANGEVLNLPQFIINTLAVGANVLVFIVPVLYMGIFTIGMVTIFKRVLSMQASKFGQKFEKFPTLWFVLSCVCFVLYMFFMSAIFS